MMTNATPEEADKLATLRKDLDVMLLGLRKMKMTKVSLLYELDKSPAKVGYRLKLKRLLDDIDRYHSKATQKKRTIARMVQWIKWREEKREGKRNGMDRKRD